jgi:hypothetical protein
MIQPSTAHAALRAVCSSTSSKKRLNVEDLRDVEVLSAAADDVVPLSYVEEPDRLFIESKDGFASIAVLAPGCPTATSAVQCDVSLPGVNSGGAEFLLLLCAMHDDPVVKTSEAQIAASEGSSGWVKVLTPEKLVSLEVRLSVPTAMPMNLVLAVRQLAGSQKTQLGCFESVTILASSEGRSRRRPRLGAPAHKLRTRSWTDRERKSAKVVGNYVSPLPILLFPKELEGGIFLRPIKKVPVVAALDRAFPAFARQLLAKVEVAHEEAPPIDFALALTLPRSSVEWRLDGPKSPVAFSGWIRVEEKFKLQDITLKVMDQNPMQLTISLAVRFPRGSESGPTNAFFRNLLFSWDE